LLVWILAIGAQQPDTGVVGYWINEKRTVVVLIAPCSGNTLCGTVQWAADKAQADAKHGGTTSLIGTQLLTDFIAVAPGQWHGTLFVPDMKKRSNADLMQLDANHIRVRGCAVGRLVCKSQVWSRDRSNGDPEG